MCRVSHRGQKRALDLPEVAFQAIVSSLMWMMLETKLQYSEITTVHVLKAKYSFQLL